MTRSVIALGANVGDRRQTLMAALERIGAMGSIVAVSALYETAPIGGPEQDDFLNAVAVVETDLAAPQVLARLHEIEDTYGRTRTEHWGPRMLDLDLILHGDDVIATETLRVPHPLYRQRRFVLEPLVDAWPEAKDPDGTAVVSMLEAVSDQELARLEAPHWWRQVVSVPESPGRGTGWVFAQMAALIGFFGLVVVTAGSIDSAAAEIAGGLVTAGGALVLVLAFNDLGPQTTPYPQPVPGGSVVGKGIYARMRHPMYGGVMAIALGLAGIAGSVPAMVAWPLLVGFFSAKARHEEARLAAIHPEYAAYRSKVRFRFIPT